MPRYQYLIDVTINNDVVEIHRQLAKRGKEGWALCAVHDNRYFYYIRPLEMTDEKG